MMMTSMLGLILLEGSAMSADEMRASPDPDGTYGPLDDILANVARMLTTETGSGA